MNVSTITEAKAQLSRLIEQVIQGEEVIIGKAGKPVAKLMPYHVDESPRELGQGSWRGKVKISHDFDEELPEEILSEFEAHL